ncbi:MAG: glycoside hydrolase family 127 protein, partial [Clostridia bacterium]|nr:glycoside hydrolase family 127 protein [Clostridia bacterium]
MYSVPFYDVTVTDGFWQEIQQLNIETTLWAVYDRFCETGRIGTMDCKVGDIQPHCYWGSDVFKWLEGACYVLEQREDNKLSKAVEHIVDMVEEGCREDGYYNSYYNNPSVTEKPFSDRIMHELYSLGHMIEAAIAHYHATGNDRLLSLAKRGADLVYRVFLEEDSAAFTTPGHEEIELALLRLYEHTGEEKYKELAGFFLKKRGNNKKDTPVMDDDRTVDQSHLPVYEQEEAVGHAVRAVYLYSAMADYAKFCKDEKMQVAAEKLFTDIYERKMYITGGIGSFRYGERFMTPYQLPNETAYAETCAALGFALFCRRMYGQKLDGRYGDGAERALFNGMISGLSLSGDAFFYKNPLEINLS